MIDLDSIISRIKEFTGVSYNKDVAELLGFSAADFSLRKKRGTLLSIILEWAINQNVNLDWLIRGEVQTKAAVNSGINEEDDVIREHMEMVRQFQDKVMAKNINWDLIRLEKIDRAALKELHEYIKFKLQLKESEESKQEGRLVGKKAVNGQ